MKPKLVRSLWLFGLAGLLAGTAWLVFRPARPLAVLEARRETLTLREGRLYRAGETTPFSGVVTEVQDHGTLRSRSRVVNGLLEGVSEGWHTNGQLQVREHFVAGISDGPRVKWHANGQKLSEATIVQGRIEGVFRRWHEDGSLAEEIPMRASQPDGLARSYFPSGFLQAEARLRDGQVLTQRFWKDGENPAPALAQSMSPSGASK